MTSDRQPWPEVALGEVAEIVCGGTPKTTVPGYWVPEVDWVTAKDVSECEVAKIGRTERCISRLGLAETSAKLLPAQSTVVIARGATMGKCRMIARPMAINQTCYGIVARAGTDPVYLYYCLCSLQGYFQTIAHGSVFNTVIGSGLHSLRIHLPPLAEQHAIAHILGALDDKIELNRHMNQTLEAIARAIFKSWFVDLEPVRAKMEGRWRKGESLPGLPARFWDLFPDRLVDSELGEIPEGWGVGTVRDILAKLVTGARPKGGAAHEGVPSVGAENVIGLGRYDYPKEKYVPREFFDQLRARNAEVRNGDVLLYKDGAYVGRKTYFDCNFPHASCAVNEHVFILRSKHRWMQRYLFFWLDTPWMTERIVALNSSSAQPGINQTGVRGLPLLLPTDRVVQEFDQTVEPLLDGIFRNCHQSRTLAVLRDALLPKLIRGEIRVKDAERSIAQAEELEVGGN